MKYNKIMLHCDIKINKNLLYRNHIRCMDVPQKHLIFYFGYNTLHIGADNTNYSVHPGH